MAASRRRGRDGAHTAQLGQEVVMQRLSSKLCQAWEAHITLQRPHMQAGQGSIQLGNVVDKSELPNISKPACCCVAVDVSHRRWQPCHRCLQREIPAQAETEMAGGQYCTQCLECTRASVRTSRISASASARARGKGLSGHSRRASLVPGRTRSHGLCPVLSCSVLMSWPSLGCTSGSCSAPIQLLSFAAPRLAHCRGRMQCQNTPCRHGVCASAQSATAAA